MLPLHFAAKNEHPEAKDLVDQLLCVHFEGAKVEDRDGLLPVHYACQNNGPTKPDFVDALLTAFPEATAHGNNKVDNLGSVVDYPKSDMLNRVIENTRIEQALNSLE